MDPAEKETHLAPFESSDFVNAQEREITMESRQKDLDEWVKTMEPVQVPFTCQTELNYWLKQNKRAEITPDIRQKELDDWRAENERTEFLKKVKRKVEEYHRKIKSLEWQLEGLRKQGEPTEFTVKTDKEEEIERRKQEEWDNRAY